MYHGIFIIMFVILHLLYLLPYVMAFLVAIFNKTDSFGIYKTIIVVLSIPQYLIAFLVVSVLLKNYNISASYIIILIQIIVLAFQVYVSYKLVDIVMFCFFIVKKIYMRIKWFSSNLFGFYYYFFVLYLCLT